MEEKILALIQLKLYANAIDVIIYAEIFEEFDYNLFLEIYDKLPLEYIYRGHQYFPRDELLCAYLNRGRKDAINNLLTIRNHKLKPITIRDINQQERIRNIKLECGNYFREKNMM